MTVNSKEKSQEDLKEYNNNPFDTEDKKPEDIVRLFYTHNVPIIPVVSKRGMLLGVMRKEDVISELSDIERVEKLKIDKFITKLAHKMSFDQLLNYGKIREFAVINIFGEVIGNWSRIDLFNACESYIPKTGSNVKQGDTKSEAKADSEDQVLEWMIFHILEHIPRGLYALNKSGKTIFYNSYFEDIYRQKVADEVDSTFMEKTLKSSEKNEMISSSGSSDIIFKNSVLDVYYEKIPLISKGKKKGFLIFFLDKDPSEGDLQIPGVNIKDLSLSEILSSLERHLITESIKKYDSLNDSANALKMTKQSLSAKIKKYGIKT